MNKELARKLRVRKITRTLLIKSSNIPAYKSAEIYFDNKGNITESLNYRRIPFHEIRIEVSDWKKFIYDANDHLVKVVDAKNDIDMEVSDVNRATINMQRYYINAHTGYVYSIFGNHVQAKRFFEVNQDKLFANHHSALRLYNETFDTSGKSSVQIRPSALDPDITSIENYERHHLPPQEVLIIDDANIIEYKYDYIFY